MSARLLDWLLALWLDRIWDFGWVIRWECLRDTEWVRSLVCGMGLLLEATYLSTEYNISENDYLVLGSGINDTMYL